MFECVTTQLHITFEHVTVQLHISFQCATMQSCISFIGSNMHLVNMTECMMTNLTQLSMHSFDMTEHVPMLAIHMACTHMSLINMYT